MTSVSSERLLIAVSEFAATVARQCEIAAVYQVSKSRELLFDSATGCAKLDAMQMQRDVCNFFSYGHVSNFGMFCTF